MLTKMLRLQLVWVFMGLLYNLVSYWRIARELSALAPTNPIVGVVFMVLCGLVISLGFRRKYKAYKYGILCLAIMLAYSGLYLHFSAYFFDPSLPYYASKFSWGLAILINVFGLFTLTIGLKAVFVGADR